MRAGAATRTVDGLLISSEWCSERGCGEEQCEQREGRRERSAATHRSRRRRRGSRKGNDTEEQALADFMSRHRRHTQRPKPSRLDRPTAVAKGHRPRSRPGPKIQSTSRRSLFFRDKVHEPQRPRKAVPEKAGPASGVPPRWRPSPLALAKQATCRPVSDGTVPRALPRLHFQGV